MDDGDAKNTKLHGNLHKQWMALTQAFSLCPSTQTNWWQIIVRRYSEEWRFYHTLQHIAHMFELFDQWRECIIDVDVVSLAIFFHDIVYDPEAKDNEEQSIVLFEKFALEAQLPSHVNQRVSELIRATISHKATQCDDHDMFLFLDFDLSILGQKSEIYKTYAHQIRQEYIHFPDEAYRKGRTQVLESLLGSPQLYLSDELKDGLEGQARRNMQQEIIDLKS